MPSPARTKKSLGLGSFPDSGAGCQLSRDVCLRQVVGFRPMLGGGGGAEEASYGARKAGEGPGNCRLDGSSEAASVRGFDTLFCLEEPVTIIGSCA
mmetsp:Transcript_4691/g.12789  ORF Transcript_4691/g.12789 Transcript_4691/m.12789 type:complete len:96 (+) Transcript_4691:282-569(+)